ncbi:Nucleotidase [bioreactor metagenome]|uniref:Nucleotidase n=1 Tax=bioreactor metagenome TaxID=1076179 RepID=A0A644XL22_9ZZZZ|nr:hydrolase [Romboutsia lituseburensis]
MNKLNICIDIDGTITNPYHFIPYLNELYNKEITEDGCYTYDWQELYGVDMDTILHEFHTTYIHSYGEAEVVEGAKEIISNLFNKHNLYFVTARNESLTEVTTNWLNDKGFSSIDVYLLGSDNKISKAKELECNIFIEDNPANALQLANEGMTVLLIDTNYNKSVEHENITRVKNWNDINEIIESYS